MTVQITCHNFTIHAWSHCVDYRHTRGRTSQDYARRPFDEPLGLWPRDKGLRTGICFPLLNGLPNSLVMSDQVWKSARFRVE